MYKTQNILMRGLVAAAVLFTLSVLLGQLSYAAGEGFLSSSLNSFAELFLLLCPYALVYFTVFYGSRGKSADKALYSLLCTSLMLTAYNLNSPDRPSLLFCIALSFFAVYVYESFSFVTASVLLTAVSFLTGFLFGILNGFFLQAVTSLAGFSSGSTVLSAFVFSLCKSIFDTLDYKGFEELFYFRSMGGSQLIDGKIVTGIADLFVSGYRGRLMSLYLTGNYVKGFALFGLSLSLSTQLRGGSRTAVILLGAASLISGNSFFLIAFLLLSSLRFLPLVSFLYVVSYSLSYILDIRCGYTLYGGIAELFGFLGKPVYFILLSAVMLALSYFAARYTVFKYGISSMTGTYVPSGLKPFCDALGGAENIISIEEDRVLLRNIKKANFLKLSCEISDNAVILKENEQLDKLKEYLK